ncbi:hypothetical protein O3G_MSEX000924 [Manduca sexta]|nr:hypothetical protein O3G_MSEX000924 [Manduca sexta]
MIFNYYCSEVYILVNLLDLLKLAMKVLEVKFMFLDGVMGLKREITTIYFNKSSYQLYQ